MLSVAILGATGMVGKMFLQVLEERKVPVAALYLFAAPREAGTKMAFRGAEVTVEALTEASFDRGIDAALFAVSNEISRKYAPLAVAKGCTVIDNSSAWRLDDTVPLVVPEVNAADMAAHRGIIASPNCCACPAAVALKPLHDAFGLRRGVISTYQSVSGAGTGGWADLTATLAGDAPGHFPHPIAHNVIPCIGEADADGYTGEETKLIAEVCKILHLPANTITATAVRVPVYSGHCLSVNIELDSPFDMQEVRRLLANAPGAALADDPANHSYPMPLTAAGTDTVHIGRVRRDFSRENGLNLWLAADNLRKGAATNAVQILEALYL